MNNPPTHTTIDWSALSSALIVLASSLILGALLIFASQQYHSYLIEWTQTQHRHFGAVEKKYTQLQETLEIVNSLYLKEFNQLITEEFFSYDQQSEKQRLKLFNQLQTLLSQLPLLGANYVLSETKLYAIHDFITVEKPFKTYETQIILKLMLLHEEDLLKLTKAIDIQTFAGLLNLQSCHIKRLRDQIDFKDASKPYFMATCVLVWHTSQIDK